MEKEKKARLLLSADFKITRKPQQIVLPADSIIYRVLIRFGQPFLIFSKQKDFEDPIKRTFLVVEVGKSFPENAIFIDSFSLKGGITFCVFELVEDGNEEDNK